MLYTNAVAYIWLFWKGILWDIVCTHRHTCTHWGSLPLCRAAQRDVKHINLPISRISWLKGILSYKQACAHWFFRAADFTFQLLPWAIIFQEFISLYFCVIIAEWTRSTHFCFKSNDSPAMEKLMRVEGSPRNPMYVQPVGQDSAGKGRKRDWHPLCLSIRNGRLQLHDLLTSLFSEGSAFI